jgi:transcriptional regulator with XRE-family HTH domain
MVTRKTYRSDVPNLLLRCRSERNLSLEEVGNAVGLSKRQVANIELGISKPRRTTRMRIEIFLRKHGYFPKPEAA